MAVDRVFALFPVSVGKVHNTTTRTCHAVALLDTPFFSGRLMAQLPCSASAGLMDRDGGHAPQDRHAGLGALRRDETISSRWQRRVTLDSFKCFALDKET